MSRLSSERARWGLLAVTLILAATLVWTTWASHRSMVRASAQLARSQGDDLVSTIRRDLAGAQRPASDRRLRMILDELRSSGLRWVALVDPRRSEILASAGRRTVAPAEPLPAAQPGEHGWLQDGDLCLLVAPAGGPGRGPRPPGRLPKGDFGPGPRRDLGPPPRRPRPRSDELRSPNRRPSDRRPPGRRPPDRDPPDRDPEDRRGPRREGPGNWLAVEFEASTARNLLQRTTGTLATGTAGALLLMVAVLLFWRQAKARESAQRRLEQREKLSALGEMSAVLAHEIRNPLASLKGHAQLLAERLPEDHPEGRKVKRIVREAARLEGLTSDLLDFVRTGELHTRPVDPVAFAEEVRREIDAERIHLHAEDAPPLWSFDPDRLRQVLTNLLRNALQASPPEAPVHLEVGVAQAQGERFLRMAVGDHGPGLPAGLEGSIFDPFVTTRTQGTGLGLAVSKRIVELHGGTLSGRNHPAGGAELEVRLPEL